MTAYTPEVRLMYGLSDYSQFIEYDISLTAGRSSITEQPQPAFLTFNALLPSGVGSKNQLITVGKAITLQVKDSAGTWVDVYKGVTSDVEIGLREWGYLGQVYEYRVTATNQLAQLNRRTAGYVNYPKQLDGERVLAILTDALLTSWSEMGIITTWQTVANVSWEDFNADIADLITSQVDTGVYELQEYSGGPADAYTLATEAADSGRGVLYSLGDGTLAYSDYSGRLSAPIITLTSAHLDPNEITRTNSIGDIVNDVEVTYRAGSESARDEQSIETYGLLTGVRNTTLHNASEAQTQARDFLAARAYPVDGIADFTIDLVNPEIDDTTRDALIGINLGTRIQATTSVLPIYLWRKFDGFVESFTWRFTKGVATLRLGCSPRQYTYPSYTWLQIPVTYNWTSYGIAYPTQDWTDIT